MKSAMISAVVTAALLAGAAPTSASDTEPMRKITAIDESAVNGELWMERRGAVHRRGNVRESREYLFSEYWNFIGYPHVVVFRREYDCRRDGARTRLLDTTYHSKDLTPDGREQGDGQWVEPTGWQRKAYDYVCGTATVSGKPVPKNELFEDHLGSN